MCLREGDQKGQSSVEYALVLLAFLCMVVALLAMWHAASEGVLLERALRAGSHNADGDGVGFVQDVSAY